MTIVMYFAIAGVRFNPVGYLTKAVEVVLIILLLIDLRRSSQSAARVAPA